MSEPDVRQRRLTRVRLAARLPKLLFGCCVGLLALAGLRTVLSERAQTVTLVQRSAAKDLVAEAFAESFARAYLTWDAARAGEHDRRITPFISDGLEAGAGLVPAGTGREQVVWTAAVQDARTGGRSRLVTVATQTTRRLAYVTVPVGRDRRGFLFVSGYPALVGGPAATTGASVPDENEVDDGALRTVAARTVRNYLARELGNLRADLANAAVVSLPPESLRVRAVEQITRARRGVVACVVSAVDRRGVELTLRYELSVVRRGRWYVRSIATDPREGGP